MNLPNIKLSVALRSKDEVRTLRAQIDRNDWSKNELLYSYVKKKDNDEKAGSVNPARIVKYSDDGTLLVYAVNKSVILLDAETLALRYEFKMEQEIHDLKFSPCNTYLATWTPVIRFENTDPLGSHNLHVYDLGKNALAFSFQQKPVEDWSPLWTFQDSIMLRKANHDIFIYELTVSVNNTSHNTSHTENNAIGVKCSKFTISGVNQWSLSPFAELLAIFIPEQKSKGLPASVRVYSQLKDLSENACSAKKTFFRADRVDFLWAQSRDLLVWTHTDVDSTGKSYYGEQHLYLLQADGKFDCCVTVDKDGPIYDVQWRPKKAQFCVVYGKMPAKAALFDNRAKIIQNFGENARNTCVFSGRGDALCLAGFGNLPGDIDIYRQEIFRPSSTVVVKNPILFKKISTLKVHGATSFQFTPDGRCFLTATLSPRLRVDNGYKVWYVDGSLLYECQITELYQAIMRHDDVDGSDFPWKCPDGLKLDAKQVAQTVVKAYVPPHLRNKVVVDEDEKVKDKEKEKALPMSAPPEKRAKNLQKKLQEIEILKQRRDNGDVMEKSQLDKITTEHAVQIELDALRI